MQHSIRKVGYSKAELGAFGFGACESKIFKYSFSPCQHHNPYHQSGGCFGVLRIIVGALKLVQQVPQIFILLEKGLLQ